MNSRRHLNAIKRRDDRETLERIKRWPGLVARFPRVRIYSAEWGAFWRGKGNGYTENAEESDVLEIGAAGAWTRHCGPEKQIQFVSVNKELVTKDCDSGPGHQVFQGGYDGAQRVRDD